MRDSEKTHLLLSSLSVQLDILIQVSIMNKVKTVEVRDIEAQRQQAVDNVLEVMNEQV